MRDIRFAGKRVMVLAVLSVLAIGTGAWSQALAGQDVAFRGDFLVATWNWGSPDSADDAWGHAQQIAVREAGGVEGASRLRVAVQSGAWDHDDSLSPRFSVLRGEGTVSGSGLRIDPRLKMASLDVSIPATLQELSFSEGVPFWWNGEATARVRVNESSASSSSGRLRITDSGMFSFPVFARIDTGAGSRFADDPSGAGDITLLFPTAEDIAPVLWISHTISSGEYGAARDGSLHLFGPGAHP